MTKKEIKIVDSFIESLVDDKRKIFHKEPNGSYRAYISMEAICKHINKLVAELKKGKKNGK